MFLEQLLLASFSWLPLKTQVANFWSLGFPCFFVAKRLSWIATLGSIKPFFCSKKSYADQWSPLFSESGNHWVCVILLLSAEIRHAQIKGQHTQIKGQHTQIKGHHHAWYQKTCTNPLFSPHRETGGKKVTRNGGPQTGACSMFDCLWIWASRILIFCSQDGVLSCKLRWPDSRESFGRFTQISWSGKLCEWLQGSRTEPSQVWNWTDSRESRWRYESFLFCGSIRVSRWAI